MRKSFRKKCPYCGSTDIARIVYGLPTPEGIQAALEGKLVPGGCEVFEDSPDQCCQICDSRWTTSSDHRCTGITETFNRIFSHWNIALPPGVEAASARGTIHKRGWTIGYLFGEDGQGRYLEYYASHRMTTDSHERLYESGRIQDLDAIETMYFFDPEVPGSEENARRRNEEQNRIVAEELDQVGLYPYGSINAYLATGKLPPS